MPNLLENLDNQTVRPPTVLVAARNNAKPKTLGTVEPQTPPRSIRSSAKITHHQILDTSNTELQAASARKSATVSRRQAEPPANRPSAFGRHLNKGASETQTRRASRHGIDVAEEEPEERETRAAFRRRMVDSPQQPRRPLAEVTIDKEDHGEDYLDTMAIDSGHQRIEWGS